MTHRNANPRAGLIIPALVAALVLGSGAARAQDALNPGGGNWGVPAPITPAMPGTMPAPMPEYRSLQPANQNLARVISATPNMDRIVETRQQCTEQWQQQPSSGVSSTTGTVMGALIGGAAGSALGKGNGRLVAVAAGSAIGSQVGRSMAEQPAAPRPVQICQPVNSVREQVRDYTVRYEWSGREYQVTLPQNPGPWLRVSTSHTVQMM